MKKVFLTDGEKKHVKSLDPRSCLLIETSAGTVTVHGSNGKSTTVAVDDTLHAIIDDEFPASLVEFIYFLLKTIEDVSFRLGRSDNPEEAIDGANE